MANNSSVVLAQMKIEGAGAYVSILSLQIDTKANSHGEMLVTLCLDSDTPGKKIRTG